MKFVRKVVLMFSSSNSNTDHLVSKTRSHSLNIVYCFVPNIFEIVRKIVLMIFRSSLNMGHLRSKSRSHNSNMKKNLVNTRDYWFSTNILKRVFLIYL